MVDIGDTLYRFDENRRQYDRNGKMVYAHHFEPMVIVDQTKQSWLCSFNAASSMRFKVNKATLQEAGKGGYHGYRWFTEQGREDAIWRDTHRMDIVRRVEHADRSTLKRILAVLDDPAGKASARKAGGVDG